jgi:hypothetical protein
MAYALHVPIYCTVLLRTVLSVRLDFSDHMVVKIYILINSLMIIQTICLIFKIEV